MMLTVAGLSSIRTQPGQFDEVTQGLPVQRQTERMTNAISARFGAVISLGSNRIITTAFAPIAVAFKTIRSIACRRERSSCRNPSSHANFLMRSETDGCKHPQPTHPGLR